MYFVTDDHFYTIARAFNKRYDVDITEFIKNRADGAEIGSSLKAQFKRQVMDGIKPLIKAENMLKRWGISHKPQIEFISKINRYDAVYCNSQFFQTDYDQYISSYGDYPYDAKHNNMREYYSNPMQYKSHLWGSSMLLSQPNYWLPHNWCNIGNFKSYQDELLNIMAHCWYSDTLPTITLEWFDHSKGASYYAYGNSCLWGQYKSFGRALDGVVETVLLEPNNNGYGSRAFLIRNNKFVVIFNGYGILADNQAKIDVLKQLGYDLPNNKLKIYKKWGHAEYRYDGIEFLNGNVTPYFNGDVVLLLILAEDSDVSPIFLEGDDCCPNCGHCYGNCDCVTCGCCGDTFSVYDMTYIEHLDQSICSYCLDRHYTYCDICNEWHHDDDCTNGMCNTCYNENYFACAQCLDDVHFDNVYQHNDEFYCLTCYQDLTES